MSIVPAMLLSAALAAGIPSTPADVGGLSLERLFPGASFDAAIPTQEKVLGFLPGTRPMRHDPWPRLARSESFLDKWLRNTALVISTPRP